MIRVGCPMLEGIIRRLPRYEIPGLNVKFVDREIECKRLFYWLLKYDISWNFVVYGPWGCGKSEFFRALTWSSQEVEALHMIYFNLARELCEVSLLSRSTLKEHVISIARSLFSNYVDLVLNLYKLMEGLCKRMNLTDSRVIVIVDEIKNIIDVYGEALEYLITNAELTSRHCRAKLNIKNMNIIFITSEQTLAERIRRYEGKSMTTLLMWHLPKNEAYQLLGELKVPKEHRDLILKVCGGCPRAMIEISKTYENNVDLWMMNVMDRVLAAIYNYMREYGRSRSEFLRELKMILEDIDEIPRLKMYDVFLKHNIILPLVQEHKRLSSLRTEGRIAYQLPIYRLCLQAMCDKGTPKITLKDIRDQLGG